MLNRDDEMRKDWREAALAVLMTMRGIEEKKKLRWVNKLATGGLVVPGLERLHFMQIA